MAGDRNVHPLHVVCYSRFIRIAASTQEINGNYCRSCLALQGGEYRIYFYDLKKRTRQHTREAAWRLLHGLYTSRKKGEKRYFQSTVPTIIIKLKKKD
jgi:hypothetical protein